MRNPLRKILSTILDYCLFAIFMASSVCGFAYVILFVIYMQGGAAALHNWIIIAAYIASFIISFSLSKYLGGGGKYEKTV